MAKQGWYIITSDQYSLLGSVDTLFTTNYASQVENIDGYYCVRNWPGIRDEIIALFDGTWEDEIEGNEVEQNQYDIIEAAYEFMYYSSEVHAWFPA